MPLAYTIEQVKEESGLGRSTIYTLIANGDLDSTTIGRRRLILAKSLEKLLARGASSLNARPGIAHEQAVERGRKGRRAQLSRRRP